MRTPSASTAEDVDDAVRLSATHISQHGIDRFYGDVALPALTDRRSHGDEHRDAHHRITAQTTMGRVLTRLGAPPAGTPSNGSMTVPCASQRLAQLHVSAYIANVQAWRPDHLNDLQLASSRQKLFVSISSL